VEDVDVAINERTPVLLVKPERGLSTPAIFKSMGLTNGQEHEGPDPRGVLSQICTSGVSQAMCMNDLEAPAFRALPCLSNLKQRLLDEESYQAVFMSGSGSTMVCWGSHSVPAWLSGSATDPPSDVGHTFVAKCHPITRSEGSWYQPLTSL